MFALKIAIIEELGANNRIESRIIIIKESITEAPIIQIKSNREVPLFEHPY